MLDSPDRRSLFVFFALFVNPLQDYAGKWEVGTSVSFTVAVNDKGPPLPHVCGLCWQFYYSHVMQTCAAVL